MPVFGTGAPTAARQCQPAGGLPGKPAGSLPGPSADPWSRRKSRRWQLDQKCLHQGRL